MIYIYIEWGPHFNVYEYILSIPPITSDPNTEFTWGIKRPSICRINCLFKVNKQLTLPGRACLALLYYIINNIL